MAYPVESGQFHLGEGERVYEVTLRRAKPLVIRWKDSQGKRRQVSVSEVRWHIAATSAREAQAEAISCQELDEREPEGQTYSVVETRVDEYWLCQYCGLAGGH